MEKRRKSGLMMTNVIVKEKNAKVSSLTLNDKRLNNCLEQIISDIKRIFKILSQNLQVEVEVIEYFVERVCQGLFWMPAQWCLESAAAY